MKIKTIGLTLLFCFVAGGVCFAVDPQMGTWKLNEAKSKHTPGMGKITMVAYKSMLGQVKVTVDGTDEKGKPTHNEWTGKYDGKDYPVTGDPQTDARAIKKVSDHKFDLTAKKGGKVVTNGTIVISADGKTRTLTTNSTDAKGKKVKSTAVYDKQ